MKTFKIKPIEKTQAIVVLILLVALNLMLISKYPDFVNIVSIGILFLFRILNFISHFSSFLGSIKGYILSKH